MKKIIILASMIIGLSFATVSCSSDDTVIEQISQQFTPVDEGNGVFSISTTNRNIWDERNVNGIWFYGNLTTPHSLKITKSNGIVDLKMINNSLDVDKITKYYKPSDPTANRVYCFKLATAFNGHNYVTFIVGDTNIDMTFPPDDTLAGQSQVINIYQIIE